MCVQHLELNANNCRGQNFETLAKGTLFKKWKLKKLLGLSNNPFLGVHRSMHLMKLLFFFFN